MIQRIVYLAMVGTLIALQLTAQCTTNNMLQLRSSLDAFQSTLAASSDRSVVDPALKQKIAFTLVHTHYEIGTDNFERVIQSFASRYKTPYAKLNTIIDCALSEYGLPATDYNKTVFTLTFYATVLDHFTTSLEMRTVPEITLPAMMDRINNHFAYQARKLTQTTHSYTRHSSWRKNFPLYAGISCVALALIWVVAHKFAAQEAALAQVAEDGKARTDALQRKLGREVSDVRTVMTDRLAAVDGGLHDLQTRHDAFSHAVVERFNDDDQRFAIAERTILGLIEDHSRTADEIEAIRSHCATLNDGLALLHEGMRSQFERIAQNFLRVAGEIRRIKSDVTASNEQREALEEQFASLRYAAQQVITDLYARSEHNRELAETSARLSGAHHAQLEGMRTALFRLGDQVADLSDEQRRAIDSRNARRRAVKRTGGLLLGGGAVAAHFVSPMHGLVARVGAEVGQGALEYLLPDVPHSIQHFDAAGLRHSIDRAGRAPHALPAGEDGGHRIVRSQSLLAAGRPAPRRAPIDIEAIDE